MIQATIAKLLGRPDKLTADECRDRLAEIADRLKEIEARELDIGYVNGGYQQGQVPGPVRLKAATTGKPADLIALDNEMRELEAEDEALHVQRDALKKAMADAELRAAPPAVAAAIKSLPRALKALEAANAAQAAALDEVQQLREAIVVNRRAAEAGGIDCPALSPELFDRLADAVHPIPEKSTTPAHPENIRLARQSMRVQLTGIKIEPPKEPELPWQALERQRKREQENQRGYLEEPRGSLVERLTSE